MTNHTEGRHPEPASSPIRHLLFRTYIRVMEKVFLRKKIRLIRKSGLFDEKAYFERYPEVTDLHINALTHYLLYGRLEARTPGNNFGIFFEVAGNRVSLQTRFSHLKRLLTDPDYIVRMRTPEEVTRMLEQKATPEQKMEEEPQVNLAEIYKAYDPAEEGSDYEPEEHPDIPENDLKLIAFYLPQFHPFEENDSFWGKGFTEWTNTSKAGPLYHGHYQPRLPGELGFYDTRVKDVLKRQIELAKQYGIYGFCLHHYFFDGKPVMRVPYEQILRNRDLDIPFCIHWANEPWTAKFDGYTDRGGILLAQHHYPKDDIAFLQDIEPALNDERYIRINGKPFLIVYRPGLFPDFGETVERWREHSLKMGFPGIYIAMVETVFEGVLDPSTYGVDAVVEFPPHYIRHINVVSQVPLYDPGFSGEIYSYPEVVRGEIDREKPDYTLFRGIFPQWDNTARRKDPKIFYGAEPALYQEWMEHIIDYTRKNLSQDKQLIFINAWNEWAEAAYIEPDRKYGYTYLNATARALSNKLKKDDQVRANLLQ